ARILIGPLSWAATAVPPINAVARMVCPARRNTRTALFIVFMSVSIALLYGAPLLHLQVLLSDRRISCQLFGRPLEHDLSLGHHKYAGGQAFGHREFGFHQQNGDAARGNVAYHL